MKMKKVIAGLIAGIVAVSAMATTAFADEESKTFGTSKGTTTSYFGEATFTTLNTVNAPFKFTVADATNTIDKIEVVSATIAGTKYEGDAAKLYASVGEDKTITLKTVGAEVGKAVSVTVKVTASDAAADWFNDATFTATATDEESTSIFNDVLFTAKTNKVVNDATYMLIPGTITALNAIDNNAFNGIEQAITAYIGDAKNVKFVVNFKDNYKAPEASGDVGKDGYDNNINFGTAVNPDDLGIMINNTKALSASAKLDGEKLTITYDWDELLASAKISSATGLVNTIAIQGNGGLLAHLADNTDRYVITGFTVIKNAEDATVDGDDAAEDDDATPAADENPKTGAAPVALALIPVALAAAVVVAKRK